MLDMTRTEVPVDGLTPMHLLLVLGIAILVLGPKRLPEAGEALGKALREFRQAVASDDAKPIATLPSAPDTAAPVAPLPPTSSVSVDPAAGDRTTGA
jgi:sec-independent protein translocase protein TatA